MESSRNARKKARQARIMQNHVASAGSWHEMRGANPQHNSPDWVGLEDVLPCAETLNHPTGHLGSSVFNVIETTFVPHYDVSPDHF